MPGSFFSSLVRRWLGQPDPNETAEVAAGSVDEVKVDLGPDESGGAGLLERWSDATSTGEPTGAPPKSPEFPEVTIRSSRAAIPMDRTIPRVDSDPGPVREVTATEVVSSAPFPWRLVLAAIAMIVLAVALALVR